MPKMAGKLKVPPTPPSKGGNGVDLKTGIEQKKGRVFLPRVTKSGKTKLWDNIEA